VAALMAMPAWRTRATRIERALFVVLCMLVPGIDHAETAVSLRANNASGVSGNIVGRRAAVPAAIGGPAKYDAKHGAVIGGTVARRKR
jgi:hypothetical protein